MWNAMTTWQRALMLVLAVIGVLGVIVGVIYIAEPAKSLPHFFPLYGKHRHRHAYHHGFAALGIGIVLLIGALLVPILARRRPQYG